MLRMFGFKSQMTSTTFSMLRHHDGSIDTARKGSVNTRRRRPMQRLLNATEEGVPTSNE